jgi:pyruvate/2-oxoglutarate/acetoin dehydrogenase E1 component
MPDLPIPFSGVLEDAYLPKPRRIGDAVRTLLGDTGPANRRCSTTKAR